MRTPALTLLALLVFAAPARADVFGPPGDVAGTADAVSVAAGDFNADGDPDLVVVGSGASVRLGAPGAAFGPATTFAAGTTPREAAIGDFNGDGDPDLAVANLASEDVSVLVGEPGPGFAAAVALPIGGAARSIATGDFNSDGDPDLAVAAPTGVVIRFGGPGSTFPAGTTLGGPASSSTAVAATDVNGDENPDLITTTPGVFGVMVRLAVGNGTFTQPVTYVTGNGPSALGAGDFDGDGDVDLAVGDSFNGKVSILVGAGDGSFGAGAVFASGVAGRPIAVADFDADGDLDLAVPAFAVELFRGSSGTAFGPAAPYGPADFILAAAVADVDGNKRPDLVTAGVVSSGVSVMRNTATAAIEVENPGLTFPAQPQGTLSRARTLTVRSSGDRALHVSGVSTGGANPDDFVVAHDRCTGATVAPGGSCTIGVRFAPQVAGARPAALFIASDAPGDPAFGLVLGGTGGALPAGPRGPAGRDRDRLVAAFAADRVLAAPRRRLTLRYVTTLAGPVTVELRKDRTLRSLRRTAKSGRNAIVLRAPRRRGRYTLALTLRAAGQTATDRARLTVRAP